MIYGHVRGNKHIFYVSANSTAGRICFNEKLLNLIHENHFCDAHRYVPIIHGLGEFKKSGSQLSEIFSLIDSLHPSQQFFSNVGMSLPRLNQY